MNGHTIPATERVRLASVASDSPRAPATRVSQTEVPTVSVVVATRDRPDMLRAAVASILDQNYLGDIEVVVVFDQSEPVPVPARVGRRRRLRTIRNKRTPGLPGARNSGILAATGSLVAFCDDDDEWLPEKLSLQVDLMRTDPETAVVASDIIVSFVDHEITRAAPRRSLCHQDLLRDRVMAIHPSSVMLRRAQLIDQIGLVDEQIPGGYGEDYELLLRASQFGQVTSVPKTLVRVNWHSSSYFAERWRIIIDALEYLLDRYPGFASEPAGLARVHGQLAFAYAAAGERRTAVRFAALALRRRWKEQRAYAALLVTARLISADRVVRCANRLGRGI